MKMFDSDNLIKLIFGSQVGVITKKEKDFLLSVFNSAHNIVIVTSEQINLDSDDLQIVKHDGPDLLLIYQKKVYAIEHFEVDASIRNAKGSTYRQKYDNNYLKRLKKSESSITGGLLVSTEVIDTKLLYKYLLENTISSFNQHYAKLDAYENKIHAINKLKNVNIKYLFYIEYKIIFPTFFIDNDEKMNSLYPHNDIHFINHIRGKDKLVGLFAYFSSDAKQIPNVNQFIMIDENNLDDYKENDLYVFDVSKLKIKDFDNPLISRFSFSIPSI